MLFKTLFSVFFQKQKNKNPKSVCCVFPFWNFWKIFPLILWRKTRRKVNYSQRRKTKNKNGLWTEILHRNPKRFSTWILNNIFLKKTTGFSNNTKISLKTHNSWFEKNKKDLNEMIPKEIEKNDETLLSSLWRSMTNEFSLFLIFFHFWGNFCVWK